MKNKTPHAVKEAARVFLQSQGAQTARTSDACHPLGQTPSGSGISAVVAGVVHKELYGTHAERYSVTPANPNQITNKGGRGCARQRNGF